MASDPEDQIMAQNKVLIDAINRYLDNDKKKQQYNRFLRVLDFYGFAGSNKNLVDFFNMPLDNPEKFKDLARVVKTWKTPSSITSVLGVLRTVYEIKEVKATLGDRYDAIATTTRDFIKLAEETAKQQKQEGTTTPLKKTPKKDESPPPSIHDDDENEDCGTGSCDEGSDESRSHSSASHQSFESKIDMTFRDMVDLRQRLLMYCEAMADIDHHTVKTMVKCIRFDVKRYLARFDED